MKKIIGIIITIISFLINSYAVLLLAAAEFDKMTLRRSGEIRTIGIVVLILSVVLFIVGLFMITAKSKKQRKMEMELSNLKYAKEYS